MRYKIWNKKEDMVTPVGRVFTAQEWIEQYPMYGRDGIDAVIADQTVNAAVCMEFWTFVDSYRSVLKFDDCTDRWDYIEKINTYEATKPVPEPKPAPVTSEERTAAALEALVMLQMEDLPEGDIQ